MIQKEKKTQVILENATHEGDTGSPEVQVAILTAFGRAQAAKEGYELTVELRSVNNRYLDLNIRLPRAWAAQEERVKTALSKLGVSRGKVDVNISVTDTRTRDGGTVLEPDMEAARRYLEAAF